MQDRMFIAIELPSDVREAILQIEAGVPGAYWYEDDQLHLTVRYLGRIDGRKAESVAMAMRRLEPPPFELALSGVGFFPPRGEVESLWVGVDKSPELERLRARVDGVATKLGIEPDRRRYMPHVTIARTENVHEGRLADFLAGHALWKSRTFRVDSLTLFSSRDRDWGPEYQREEVFLLRP
jgi:2'-5' RNA ligase